jgi:hypothetical protein
MRAAVLLLLACAAAVAGPEAERDPYADWRFIAGAWLWAPGLSGTAGADGLRARVDPRAGAGLTQRAEIWPGDFGFTFESTSTLLRGDGGGKSEAWTFAGVTDLSASIRLPLADGLDLLPDAGLRYLSARVRMEDRAGGQGSSGERWLAPRAGLAGEVALSDGLALSLRAGLSALDGDRTSDLSVALGARLSESATLVVGWRRLGIDASEGRSSRRLRLDAAASGPFAGILFHF